LEESIFDFFFHSFNKPERENDAPVSFAFSGRKKGLKEVYGSVAIRG